MSKPTGIEMMRAFQEYVNAWQELEAQYWRIKPIPIYHFIMTMINLNKRGKLTRDYTKKMKEWGIVQ